MSEKHDDLAARRKLLECAAKGLEDARAEHRRTFPAENHKAANIALGGLRRVAAVIVPSTFRLGNEEAIARLRAAIRGDDDA